MRLELHRRPVPSRTLVWLSPFLAVALTLLASALIFAASGRPPVAVLQTYFLSPLQSAYSLQEILVKASPLILIAVGLSFCFRANVWNIGAEGQFVLGAIAGGVVALTFSETDSPVLLPAMLVAGVLGGMAWAAIPALLKARFRANEILTSLMLVYVAGLLLDYLVRGPLRDPAGFGFPQSRMFHEAATMPLLMGGGRLHWGVVLAVVVAVLAYIYMERSVRGFSIRVIGLAPRAGLFGGFSPPRTIVFTFLVSGGLAGLAGAIEVAGPIGQLQPLVSPGYGFTAIIVAFIGRLNPLGIVVAALLLALSYIGGEAAQIRHAIALDVTRVIQGLLLFFLLACDTFIAYRLRWAAPRYGREVPDAVA